MNRYRSVPSMVTPLMRTTVVVLSAMCALCSGCATATTTLWWKKEKPSNNPTSVVEFWKEDVMEFAGVPTRGFGGRLMFYDQNAPAELRECPVKINGRLTIYAFNDADYERGSTAAEKKFVFESEEVEKAYSEASLMGHSYSFWLPWDTNIDGERQKICLIAILENKNHVPVLRSNEANRVMLPGKNSKPSGVTSSTVRRASVIDDSGDRTMNRISGIRDEWNLDNGGSDNQNLISRKTRRTETIPLTRTGAFAQPGAPGVEQQVQKFELPKLHQRKTTGKTDTASGKGTNDAVDAGSDAKQGSSGKPENGGKLGSDLKSDRVTGKTPTVLVGPLNDNPDALAELSTVLGKRTAYPIGQGPAT